jgi:osmotically-inducible protein OsmY
MILKALVKVALAGALLIGSGAAVSAATTEDVTTKLNVKLVLLEKLGTDSLHVDVEAAGGAVSLKGTVVKRETRELAESTAKSVNGVKTVKNDIKLEASEANPSKSSVAAGEAEAELKDAILATKVRLALVEKMGEDGFKVGTEVASGVVELRFEKDFTAARRQEATKIVKGVEGVTKVVSVDKK